MSKPHAPLKPSGVDQRPAPGDEPARPDQLSGVRPAGGLGARSPWAFVHAVADQAATTGGRAGAAPAADERPDATSDWADDERLDELFSAWAEAALSAEVISERRFMGEEPEAAPAPQRPVVAPAGQVEPASATAEHVAAVDTEVGPASVAAENVAAVDTEVETTVESWSAPAAEIPGAARATVPAVPAVPVDALADRWEPSPAWSRGDDDIIPRPRARGRWRR